MFIFVYDSTIDLRLQRLIAYRRLRQALAFMLLLEQSTTTMSHLHQQPLYTKAMLLVLAKSSDDTSARDTALATLALRQDAMLSLEDLADICMRGTLSRIGAVSVSQLVIKYMRAGGAASASWAPMTINALLASFKKHVAHSTSVSFALVYLYVIKFDAMEDSRIAKVSLSVYELIGQALHNMLLYSAENIKAPAMHLMDTIATTIAKNEKYDAQAKAALLLRGLDGIVISPDSVSTLWPFLCLSAYKHPALTLDLKRKLIRDPLRAWVATRSNEKSEFKSIISNLTCANVIGSKLGADLCDQEFLDEINSEALDASLVPLMVQKLNSCDRDEMMLAGCLIASHPVWQFVAKLQHRESQRQPRANNDSLLCMLYYYFKSQDIKVFMFPLIEGLIKCCNSCGAEGCGSQSPKLRVCACARAWYCNKECQRKDWRAGHKSSCTLSSAAVIATSR